MEVINELPSFIRDFGVFVTILVFGMMMLRFSPFAFKLTGNYTFIIGRNGGLKAVSEVANESDTIN